MDLKALREGVLKQTRPEFAQFFGISEAEAERWEASGPPLDAITKLAQQTGLDFNTIMGYQKPAPKPIRPNATWPETASAQKCTADYIARAREQLDLPDELQKKYIDGLAQYVDSAMVKPRMMIVGRSDTGKSSLINALLGSEEMPASWTPTTSIAVYIKHLADKPSFMPKNETTWVFANCRGEEDLWDVRRYQDEAYCRSWKIAAGGADILRHYGVRKKGGQTAESGAAIMFIDAPILKNCDIVDLPGFGTETASDDQITFKATQAADIIIYLSQANGFMRIEDITYLKEHIRRLPVWEKRAENKLKPLSNLFVVASQAHTVNAGNKKQLQRILNAGCENFIKTLPEGYWREKAALSGYSVEDYSRYALPCRFFTYTTDIPALCEAFQAELTQLLEMFPVVIRSRTKEGIQGYLSQYLPGLREEIGNYEDIRDDRDIARARLKQLRDGDLDWARENSLNRDKAIRKIDALHAESVQKFCDYCAREINVDAIVQSIKSKGIKNSKRDVELFVSQFQSTIQQEMENILVGKSGALAVVAEAYQTEFHKGLEWFRIDRNPDWMLFLSFLEATATMTGFGGIIMKSFAGCAGPALGLPAFKPISELFGFLGVTAGLAISSMVNTIPFIGGWEKSVAKKLVQIFNKENVQGAYTKIIDDYWEARKQVFVLAAQQQEKDRAATIERLSEVIRASKAQDLDNKLSRLKNLEDFLINIPL